MVDKFIKLFFSEADLYGEDICAGIFGNYIVDKILKIPITTIDLYIYDTKSISWNETLCLKRLETVWNIFEKHKIHIVKEELFYSFSIYDVAFRIFTEKPYIRTNFTFETLQYNKYCELTHNTQNTNPLYLLKILNDIKKRKLVPLYPKYFILDHDFFIADKEHYIQLVEHSYNLTQQGWYFDPKTLKLHYTIHDICSICQNDDMHLKLKLKCGHNFHKDCIKQLILLKPEEPHCNLCPNCRSPIQIFYK